VARRLGQVWIPINSVRANVLAERFIRAPPIDNDRRQPGGTFEPLESGSRPGQLKADRVKRWD
jgi:hypothetical protein